MIKKALDLFRLNDKVALVTGGSGIVGSPITCALAEAGATVIVTSRNLERCTAFAAKLMKQGFRAKGEKLDLSSESSIRGLCDRILSLYGRLDIVFNNAVARAGGDFRHMSTAEWEHAMRVNSSGLFLACQIFSEPMQTQRAGSIVNISSIYGMVGPDFSIYQGTAISNPANYAFAKGGVIALTRYLASFLAPHRIRVNCLSFGGVRTNETPAIFERNYRHRTLLDRMAGEEDIKGPALFLASDASGYVTGQNIAIDGGWTAI